MPFGSCSAVASNIGNEVASRGRDHRSSTVCAICKDIIPLSLSTGHKEHYEKVTSHILVGRSDVYNAHRRWLEAFGHLFSPTSQIAQTPPVPSVCFTYTSQWLVISSSQPASSKSSRNEVGVNSKRRSPNRQNRGKWQSRDPFTDIYSPSFLRSTVLNVFLSLFLRFYNNACVRN